jgi:predicted transcriptional regulator
MDGLLARLTELGFGEYEARAYITLLQHSPVNGYELSRHSGVPRGSIYGALARLEEKGAVVRQESPDGTRFAPVASDEVLRNCAGRFERTLKAIESELAVLAPPPDTGGVLNTRGYSASLDHARALVGSAQRSLMLAVWPQEAAALREETAAAVTRDVQIHTLCLANCPRECGHCRGQVYRYDVAPEEEKRWLLLAPDGREVLAAEIGPETTGPAEARVAAVRTRQRLVVALVEAYIRQSIALAAILTDLGPTLIHALARQTRDHLNALRPAAAKGGPWEFLRRLLVDGEPSPASGESD